MSTVLPSLGQLQRALTIAKQIESLRTALADVLGQPSSLPKATGKVTNGTAKPKRKYNFSPEARAKIAAAQKARWAKQKKTLREGQNATLKK